MNKPDRVELVAQEALDLCVAEDPFLMDFLGAPGARGEVPRLEPGFRDGLRRRAVALGVDVDTIDLDDLDVEDRLTVELVRFDARRIVESIDIAREEFTVSATTARSPIGAIANLIPKTQVTDLSDAGVLLDRIEQLPQMVDEATEALRRGARAERHPVRLLVQGGQDQLDRLLQPGAVEDSLGGVALPAGFAGADEWREDTRALVTSRLRPALERHASYLREAMPAARDDDRPGLCHVPGGAEAYAALVRYHTTLDWSPETVHQRGLDVVAELGEEARELGRRAWGADTLGQVLDRLANDRSLFYETSAQILTDATRAFERAREVVPQWIGSLPQTPCEVNAMPEDEALRSPMAYYRPTPPDSDRHGSVWINTAFPEGKSRYELRSLMAHESIPGHHIQFALQRETKALVPYRRYAAHTSFIEGWALYAERLGEAMGLYDDDLDLLGVWAQQNWRAARLVVDTGLHAMGWSRDQAVHYLRRNTPTSDQVIGVEVNRYIGGPGQALAYMTGAIEHRAARAEAQEALGERFDVRAYHDVVLGHGSLPLPVLRSLVRRWAQAPDPHAPSH